jgi:hypothetical protein
MGGRYALGDANERLTQNCKECSFLKKRTKKLLSVCTRTELAKVCCFFFSKKKAFLPS